MTGQKVVRFLGTRGVPASHGGFETAVENIGLYLVERGWRVVIYCQSDERGALREDTWRGIERVLVPGWRAGPAGTAVFDLQATRHAASHDDLCLTFGYNTAAVNLWQNLRGTTNLFNMDGIEWKRTRWGRSKRAAFYLNERIACRIGRHLIADHPVIADHLAQHAPRDKISTIAYGAPSITAAGEESVSALGLTPGDYSTVICRPVEENSLLEIVQAFSARRRDHALVMLGTFTREDPYHAALLDAASDECLFPGVVYEPEAIGALRFHSRTYIHGHTVGGTNPSLVEALGAGNPVIAHDNVYNRWVAGPEHRYFADTSTLTTIFDELLDDTDALTAMSRAARERHRAEFTWDRIAAQYERLLERFLPAGP